MATTLLPIQQHPNGPCPKCFHRDGWSPRAHGCSESYGPCSSDRCGCRAAYHFYDRCRAEIDGNRCRDWVKKNGLCNEHLPLEPKAKRPSRAKANLLEALPPESEWKDGLIVRCFGNQPYKCTGYYEDENGRTECSYCEGTGVKKMLLHTDGWHYHSPNTYSRKLKERNEYVARLRENPPQPRLEHGTSIIVLLDGKKYPATINVVERHISGRETEIVFSKNDLLKHKNVFRDLTPHPYLHDIVIEE